jgi:thioredoxin 2
MSPLQVQLVCPHCDRLNRLPQAKLEAGGKCGKPLFEGRPLALGQKRFDRHLEKSDLPLELGRHHAAGAAPGRPEVDQQRAAARPEPGLRLVKVNVDEEQGLRGVT